MTEIEQQLDWSSAQELKEEIVYAVQYDDEQKEHEFEEEINELPMIVVESNQQTDNSDAPIVIYPNDPSVVGAEVVVGVQASNELQWTGFVADEEIVVPATDDAIEEIIDSRIDDFGDIPLNDESYATYHPFPCDFCCRRFKKKANLINHMVAHQTQRPHACNACSSRFMRKCDLVNHQKIHSYVPNRDNRTTVEENPPATNPTKKRVGRPRRRSSGSARNTAYRYKPDNQGSSPSSSPDNSYYFKPTSYVDEDVKLLLEMTTKLHESRKSESDTNTPVVKPEIKREGVEGRPYVCNVCGRCFARESALVSHTQIHAQDSSYDCNKCGSRFFTEDLLREHYSKKHDSVYSGDSSDTSEDKEDKGSYTGDERFGTFYCPICAISFHRLDQLKQHKKIHSRRDDYAGLYKCRSCQSMFLTHEKLLEHYDGSVNCQKNICLLCGEECSDQKAVQSHIQQMHQRDMPPHTCTFCGKQCRDPKTLKRHFWVHVVDKRHSTTRESHKTVHCDECDEEFPDRRSLLNHRHSHYSSSSSQKRFVCNECGKSFGSRSSQQIHNRIHTGERPYGCRYCWKAFADGGTLRKHERIHTGEKPYVCAVCPRAFNQRVVLREHIRSHHSGSVNKMGYSVPVFLCSVCGIVTSGSDELALHLVKHSDDNTVKNRAPATGIRSYKRRKKPDTARDADYYRVSEFEEADFFDNRNSETDSAESEKHEEPKRNSRGRRLSNRYARFNRTIDAAVKNIASLVEQPVRKAKMINTKLQTAAAKTKRGVKRRGRRAVEVSSVVTVLKPRVRTMSGRLSGRGDSFSEPQEESSPEKSGASPNDGVRKNFGRPRTKNVNYETLRALSQGLPPAIFPEHSESPSKVDMVKQEPDENDTDGSQNLYACSVCNVSFVSKADLLDHVPIHI